VEYLAIKKQLCNPFVGGQNQQSFRKIIESTDSMRAFRKNKINLPEHIVVKLIPNKLRKHIVGFVENKISIGYFWRDFDRYFLFKILTQN
jgi:hypothetical protein